MKYIRVTYLKNVLWTGRIQIQNEKILCFPKDYFWSKGTCKMTIFFHFSKISKTNSKNDFSWTIQTLTLTSVCRGMGPPRYRSAVSMWFEIMSSSLVTFTFKSISKRRETQFWNFLPEIWKICNQRQLVSIDFEKKNQKSLIFSHFFK